MEHIEERDCCKLDFWKIIFFTDYNLTLNNNKYHINCIHDMMIQIVTTDIIVLNNRNEIDEQIQNGNRYAMYNLADYYRRCHNYDEMKKYHEMAISHNLSWSAYSLGLFYKVIETDYEKMKHYLHTAIDINNHMYAFYELAKHHRDIEIDHDKMEYYFMHGISAQNTDCMLELADYYDSIDQHHDDIEKYYKMAINNGQFVGFRKLIKFYEKKNNHDKIKNYCMELLNDSNRPVNVIIVSILGNLVKYMKPTDIYKKCTNKDEMIHSFTHLDDRWNDIFKQFNQYTNYDMCELCYLNDECINYNDVNMCEVCAFGLSNIVREFEKQMY